MQKTGLWKALQVALIPTVPVPHRAAVLQSLASALVATTCSDTRIDSAVDVYKSTLEALCNMTGEPSCRETLEAISEAKETSLCELVKKLLALSREQSPYLRLRQQSIVLLALAGVVLKLESYTPLITLDEFRPPLETQP